MGDWRGLANRGDLTWPVAEFRATAVKKFGLLRKAKGRLLLTRAGAAVDGKPAALFTHLAARIAPPRVTSDTFAVDADLPVLAYATVSSGTDLPVETIALHRRAGFSPRAAPQPDQRGGECAGRRALAGDSRFA
ncbi:hypothetical protein [Promicromonospora sp. NPDC023987]|uniref:hypothetical protein n=1 Tax=Promicromonospora sp. NPDC023987 TaxID=3155360 RepID=UPI0033DA3617